MGWKEELEAAETQRQALAEHPLPPQLNLGWHQCAVPLADLAATLGWLRVELKRKRKVMARAMGCHHTALIHHEHQGYQRMRLETLVKFCDALGLDVTVQLRRK